MILKADSSKCLEVLETDRLLLRKPTSLDAPLIFDRYACDPEVTRFMSWPTHRTVADTEAFLRWSDADWERWPAGSYLVLLRERPGHLLGSTGLSFLSLDRAVTGYVFSKDAWGKGYATEALTAMIELAQHLNVRRLEAICHVDHQASAHVLEKCGFNFEGILRGHTEFPNYQPGLRLDVRGYAREF